MALGITFSSMSWDDFEKRINVLIAYLVFSAEGFFSLLVCTYRFLVVWQRNHLGVSPLEPPIPSTLSARKRMRLRWRRPMTLIIYTLIGANAVIIAGSGLLASSMNSDNVDEARREANKGKALRVAGTAVFLALVQIFGAVAIWSYRRHGNRTLLLILGTWPLLTIRGVYGILSVLITAFSYYSSSTFTDSGFSPTFIVGEHVLGTLMEWISCGLLLSTYFTSLSEEHVERHEGSDRPIREWEERGVEMAPKWVRSSA
ncbi:hypothetical protein BCR35DRAFT_302341 [Leucosporidium creatinivorum]|uniref:Frag1/DRAM/Sfk1 family-domain-containing protein n=1 Tax=Leucosporidium creatinivorum TaxID=106004 RepID=A0A1Y2FTL0_9BASI|nr:hypothetical protein BCR35DRAFT_302341 [Leucosporidium creatinivorum]